MRKIVVSIVCFASLAGPLSADDGLPPKTLAAVKRATVFVEVEVEGLSGSGSGFVVSVDGTSALVVTNHHVVEPKILAQTPSDSKIQFAARPPTRTSRPPIGNSLARPPHVIILSPSPIVPVRPFYVTPRLILRTLKNAVVTVVFDSGTKDERSAKAELLAIDPQYDLAVMRVKDVKDLPEPIKFEKPAELTETMAVYTFGFPLGQVLSRSKGRPAITVSKTAISSLREDDEGNLVRVQIDGGIKPGNSGGPVVNTNGELVGVAVAIIRDSLGIGMAIPSGPLRNVFEGRIGDIHLAAKPNAEKPALSVEVGVIDPLNKIKSVELHSIAVSRANVSAEQGIESLGALPGTEKTKLSLEMQLASGEVALASSTNEKEYLVQAVYTTADGKPKQTRVFRQSLAPMVVAATPSNPAPAAPNAGGGNGGSSGTTPSDRNSPPPSPGSEAQKSAVSPNGEFRDVAPEKGLLIGFEFAFGPMLDKEVLKAVRPIFRNGQEEVLGKQYGTDLNRVVVVKAKEGYAVGGMTVRNNLFVCGLSVMFLRVRDGRLDPQDSYQTEWIGEKTGGRERVIKADGTPVLGIAGDGQASHYMRLDLVFEKTSVVATITPDQNRSLPKSSGGESQESNKRAVGKPRADEGQATKILGAVGNTAFKDLAPEDGLLVGLEIGLGKFGKLDVVKAIRPIYRAGEDETLGQQYGTELNNVITVKAKQGYAVGGITVRAGALVNGLSVTFMRVVDGKLAPNDSYASDWIGDRTGGGETKLNGDGKPVIGIVGKANARDCGGLGLLFIKK